MSKPVTQKSQLSVVVVISFLVLGSSTLFSLSKVDNPELTDSCLHEMKGKISVLTSNNKDQLVITDSSGRVYYPVIAGEKAILTVSTSARICYNEIDASNPNHKIIYVEKVVSLPSRNEKR